MSVDLEELRRAHLDRHGPSRICAGPETCSSVGYLKIIADLAAALDVKRETLRRIYQCRINNGNGTICRSCWEQSDWGSR